MTTRHLARCFGALHDSALPTLYSRHLSMKKPPATTADRRNFLKAGGAVAAGLLGQSVMPPRAAAALPAVTTNPRTVASMPPSNRGRNGYEVGIFSLGDQAAIEHAKNFD